MTERALAQKKCTPCRGGVPPLNPDEVQSSLPQVTGWSAADGDRNTTQEPEPLENLHGTDLLWEGLKSQVLRLLSGVSLADIATESAHWSTDDETDSSPAFGANMQSTARH